MPLVSIVIVNYNAGQLLGRCLRTIRTQTHRNLQVIVVDNASRDDSLDSLANHSDIIVLRNSTNLGFAAAQNQGLHLADGQYLMPLNFDLELTPTFIECLLSTMQSDERIGTVTGKLLQMTPEGKHTSAIYSTGHVLGPDRFIRHRGTGEVDRGQYDTVDEVFGAPGAAPLYRRQMLNDAAFRGSFFDESLFMWYEDVDLDWRAHTLGWKCVYTPRAVAYHIGHPEGHQGDARQIATTIRNRWLVILANEHSLLSLPFNFATIAYEIGLLKYVISAGYVRPYVTALQEFLQLAPIALAKRRFTREKVTKQLDGKLRWRHIHG